MLLPGLPSKITGMWTIQVQDVDGSWLSLAGNGRAWKYATEEGAAKDLARKYTQRLLKGMAARVWPL